jgi:hypothetical protein
MRTIKKQDHYPLREGHQFPPRLRLKDGRNFYITSVYNNFILIVTQNFRLKHRSGFVRGLVVRHFQ